MRKYFEEYFESRLCDIMIDTIITNHSMSLTSFLEENESN